MGYRLAFQSGQCTESKPEYRKDDPLVFQLETLKMITHDNAELLALSGRRNPYPGKLGVIEEGALADLIVVDGNALEDIKVLTDPGKNMLLIMKDGKIYKNDL